MNWKSNLSSLAKLYKAAAADSKCGSSSSLWSRLALSRQLGDKAAKPPELKLNREFFVRLWMADKEIDRVDSKIESLRRNSRVKGTANMVEDDRMVQKQQPVSQSISGYLKPESPEELKVMPLCARSNMLITRDIEWANLVLGFEQENRYGIVDVCYPQVVSFVKSHILTRQLLRQRRPFVARITDGMLNELFRVRRPFWWINSSIYAEINGKEIGVVHRRWHLWRRIYDLYLRDEQFAVVENPGFWNWTFTLKDINGGVLAQIDCGWRGFGFELFTDAGQYVIRFGSSNPSSKTGLASQIEELEVARPLNLSERAITLALAISLDNDYFSRHGGWGMPYYVGSE